MQPVDPKRSFILKGFFLTTFAGTLGRSGWQGMSGLFVLV
jgi:hypothetical protein